MAERDRLNRMLDGGEHMDDHSHFTTREPRSVGVFPNQVMLELIETQGFQRPQGGKKTR